MSEKPKTAEMPLVSCQVCLKEVPKSVANSLEGSEYVYYFCGADCYQQWQKQGGNHAGNPPARVKR